MQSRTALRVLTATTLSTLIAFAPSHHARAQATQYADKPPLLLGAAWYPEQWPESRWDADLSLMEAAHIHLVRI
jgi:beta-galactosidase